MSATLALAGWENFYVIIGSAAAGLTGLTFVVIALAERPSRRHAMEAAGRPHRDAVGTDEPR